MPDTAHDLETAPDESRSSGDGNSPALVSFTEEADSPETARQLDIAAEDPAFETVAAQDDDIAPEDEAAPPESGLNEYRYDPSSLLTGIDRLGFLGSASFLKEAYPLAPIIEAGASVAPPNGPPSTASPVPVSPREDDEPLPPTASGINSRFVMFLDKSLLSPDDTLYFSMAGYAQNEQDPLLAGSALATVEGYGTVSVNADGGIVYTLKSEAETAVKNGETLVDHIRYTDVNGAVRTIQVVITADPVYNSRAFPGWSQDLYETHWGNIFLVDYNVTATGNDDVLTFEGLQGGTIIAGAGHDAVTVPRHHAHDHSPGGRQFRARNRQPARNEQRHPARGHDELHNIRRRG